MTTLKPLLKHFGLWPVLLLAAGLLISGQSLPAQTQKILMVTLEDDTINPVTADHISKALDRAQREEAVCLILKLDTPGGLLTSTRTIVKDILASRVPVVVYVAPSGSRAGSAGVFITYASHVAAMAPSTNIGTAHPVQAGGGEKPRGVGDALRDFLDARNKENKAKGDGGDAEDGESTTPLEDKILNDTVAFIRAMARERGRNEEWAVKSVTESASISEQEALELGVIELVAVDEQNLLRQLDGRGVTVDGKAVELKTAGAVVERIQMDFRQRLLNVLANPNISYILLMLGFYGLLFEVTNPGFGVPGVMGTIFIIVALFSLQMLPTNYAGLGLILLGILLFTAEVFAPGFGLLTLGGILCIALGSLFLFESSSELMRVSYSLIFAFTASTAAITLVLVRMAVKSYRLKKQTGMEGLIGTKGEAAKDFGPSVQGKIFIHGELWSAASDEEIHKGDAVEVTGHEGLLLKVKLKRP